MILESSGFPAKTVMISPMKPQISGVLTGKGVPTDMFFYFFHRERCVEKEVERIMDWTPF